MPTSKKDEVDGTNDSWIKSVKNLGFNKVAVTVQTTSGCLVVYEVSREPILSKLFNQHSSSPSANRSLPTGR